MSVVSARPVEDRFMIDFLIWGMAERSEDGIRLR